MDCCKIFVNNYSVNMVIIRIIADILGLLALTLVTGALACLMIFAQIIEYMFFIIHPVFILMLEVFSKMSSYCNVMALASCPCVVMHSLMSAWMDLPFPHDNPRGGSAACTGLVQSIYTCVSTISREMFSKTDMPPTNFALTEKFCGDIVFSFVVDVHPTDFIIPVYKVRVIMADLATKLPGLECLLRPEYAPYYNTAGTVLLGWMVVCWFLNLVWTFLAPLAVSILGVIIVCPATAKWLLGQFAPSAEIVLQDILQKVQVSLPEVRQL